MGRNTFSPVRVKLLIDCITGVTIPHRHILHMSIPPVILRSSLLHSITINPLKLSINVIHDAKNATLNLFSGPGSVHQYIAASSLEELR